jgi:hypothetical protein
MKQKEANGDIQQYLIKSIIDLACPSGAEPAGRFPFNRINLPYDRIAVPTVGNENSRV